MKELAKLLDIGFLRTNFETCYGCQICKNFCPSFPAILKAMDDELWTKKPVLEERIEEIADLCYDCKLCELACPFTFDVPHWLTEAKAKRVAKVGRTVQTRMLTEPVLLDKVGGVFAPLANMSMKMPLFRAMLDASFKIHRERLMPPFHFRDYGKWYRANRTRLAKPDAKRKVVLFAGCFATYNEPAEPIAVANLLAANRVEVAMIDEVCCGLPKFAEGYMAGAKREMHHNMRPLLDSVRRGYDVIVVSTPCCLTIKREYGYMDATDDAKLLAEHTFDAGEYVLKLKNEGALSLSFKPVEGKVYFHAPCHSKALKNGLPGMEVLRLIPMLEIAHEDTGCCGIGGAWGMKSQTHDMAMKTGAPMFAAIKASNATMVATDCPQCKMQIRQGVGASPPVYHPLELLRY